MASLQKGWTVNIDYREVRIIFFNYEPESNLGNIFLWIKNQSPQYQACGSSWLYRVLSALDSYLDAMLEWIQLVMYQGPVFFHLKVY